MNGRVEIRQRHISIASRANIESSINSSKFVKSFWVYPEEAKEETQPQETGNLLEYMASPET